MGSYLSHILHDITDSSGIGDLADHSLAKKDIPGGQVSMDNLVNKQKQNCYKQNSLATWGVQINNNEKNVTKWPIGAPEGTIALGIDANFAGNYTCVNRLQAYLKCARF